MYSSIQFKPLKSIYFRLNFSDKYAGDDNKMGEGGVQRFLIFIKEGVIVQQYRGENFLKTAKCPHYD